MPERPWDDTDSIHYVALLALAPEMAEAILAGDRLDSDEACNEYQGGPCRRTDTKPCFGCVSVWAVKDAAAKLRALGGGDDA